MEKRKAEKLYFDELTKTYYNLHHVRPKADGAKVGNKEFIHYLELAIKNGTTVTDELALRDEAVKEKLTAAKNKTSKRK